MSPPARAAASRPSRSARRPAPSATSTAAPASPSPTSTPSTARASTRPSTSSPASPPSTARTVLATEVSPGGAVEALALRDGARTILWLANLTAEAVTVELPAELAGARIVSLDADAFEELTRAADYLSTAAHALPAGPVRLDAYAVARLEA